MLDTVKAIMDGMNGDELITIGEYAQERMAEVRGDKEYLWAKAIHSTEAAIDPATAGTTAKVKWMKTLPDEVDWTKPDGYAFGAKWVRRSGLMDLDNGTHIVASWGYHGHWALLRRCLGESCTVNGTEFDGCVAVTWTGYQGSQREAVPSSWLGTPLEGLKGKPQFEVFLEVWRIMKRPDVTSQMAA